MVKVERCIPDAFQSADRRKDFAEDVLGDIRADVADCKQA